MKQGACGVQDFFATNRPKRLLLKDKINSGPSMFGKSRSVHVKPRQYARIKAQNLRFLKLCHAQT